jgi:hypothetical protein
MVQVRQIIAGTPPVTGVSQLGNLSDVNSANKQDQRVIAYSDNTGKHEYYSLDGFSVDSANSKLVFGPDTLSLSTLTITDSATIANQLTVAGLRLPTADGTAGMAIVTDGSGTLTFQFAGTEAGVVVTQMQDLTDTISTLNSIRSDGHYLRFDSATGKYTSRDFDSDVTAIAGAGISVTDTGGLGSLSYADGVITYTGASNADVRTLFSATGDISYDSSTGIFDLNVETVYTKANFDSDLGLANTAQLTEGTNLYYTTARVDSDFDARLAIKSTTNLTEGSNLYYTDVRADGRIAAATSDDITQGITNLYYTTGLFDTRLATKTTTNLAEGTNLYYTLARADSAIDDKITQAYIKATGITFDDVTDNNATTTNTITIGQLNTTGGIVQHTPAVAATISSDSTTLIDATVHNSGFTSIEYIVQINNDSASETQISKITAAFDKTAVSISEFGIVHTGDSDLGAFTADVSGGDIRLFFQRRPSNTITLKSTKTIIQ